MQPASSLDVQSFVLQWLARYREYPRAARHAHLEGTVLVRIVLMPDGRLVMRHLIQSSGHDLLDRAALELIERASPVQLPADNGLTDPVELQLPLIYRLSA
ncbi:MAG TPA: energy transducer TonB [Rudaea sp.]